MLHLISEKRPQDDGTDERETHSQTVINTQESSHRYRYRYISKYICAVVLLLP